MCIRLTCSRRPRASRWRSGRPGRSARPPPIPARARRPASPAIHTAPPTTSWSTFRPPATSAPAPGTATPAAASPTTPSATSPVRCLAPAACPTERRSSSASADSVTSNPVEVFVHAQVSSIALALSGSAEQCFSQGTAAQLDAQACYASNGKQYELCAPVHCDSTMRARAAWRPASPPCPIAPRPSVL